MGEIPGNLLPPLYRHLNDDDAVESHSVGNLWLRSFKYFRDIEDDPRRDPQEGLGAYQVGEQLVADIDQQSLRQYYILCFTENSAELQFGSEVMRLTNHEALKESIELSLPRQSFVRLEKVIYGKCENLENKLSPVEFHERKTITKPIGFAKNNEWRYLVGMPVGFKILNDTLKINVGQLNGILDRYRSK